MAKKGSNKLSKENVAHIYSLIKLKRTPTEIQKELKSKFKVNVTAPAIYYYLNKTGKKISAKAKAPLVAKKEKASIKKTAKTLTAGKKTVNLKEKKVSSAGESASTLMHKIKEHQKALLNLKSQLFKKDLNFFQKHLSEM